MNFTYEIKAHIATLSKSESGNITTEVNLISYNGDNPKLDIRKWDRRTDKMLKGIALTNGEVYKLQKALEKYFTVEDDGITTLAEMLGEPEKERIL